MEGVNVCLVGLEVRPPACPPARLKKVPSHSGSIGTRRAQEDIAALANIPVAFAARPPIYGPPCQRSTFNRALKRASAGVRRVLFCPLPLPENFRDSHLRRVTYASCAAVVVFLPHAAHEQPQRCSTAVLSYVSLNQCRDSSMHGQYASRVAVWR